MICLCGLVSVAYLFASACWYFNSCLSVVYCAVFDLVDFWVVYLVFCLVDCDCWITLVARCGVVALVDCCFAVLMLFCV